MTIKQWPKLERPRERLLKLGAHSLSDAELLAIFLRTGCSGKSALDLARELLSKFGSLRAVLNSSMTEFCQNRGLGEAKYAQLRASMEMAKRHLGEKLQNRPIFSHCDTVKRFLCSELRDLTKEAFYLLYLDNQQALIHHEALFVGTIDSAAVYPREVVIQALKHNAAAVIFAHNHPSGNIQPSNSDIRLTERLVKALDLVDIRTLDHLIIGDGHVLSFAEEGLLPKTP